MVRLINCYVLYCSGYQTTNANGQVDWTSFYIENQQQQQQQTQNNAASNTNANSNTASTFTSTWPWTNTVTTTNTDSSTSNTDTARQFQPYIPPATFQSNFLGGYGSTLSSGILPIVKMMYCAKEYLEIIFFSTIHKFHP